MQEVPDAIDIPISTSAFILMDVEPNLRPVACCRQTHRPVKVLPLAGYSFIHCGGEIPSSWWRRYANLGLQPALASGGMKLPAFVVQDQRAAPSCWRRLDSRIINPTWIRYARRLTGEVSHDRAIAGQGLVDIVERVGGADDAEPRTGDGEDAVAFRAASGRGPAPIATLDHGAGNTGPTNGLAAPTFVPASTVAALTDCVAGAPTDCTAGVLTD